MINDKFYILCLHAKPLKLAMFHMLGGRGTPVADGLCPLGSNPAGETFSSRDPSGTPHPPSPLVPRAHRQGAGLSTLKQTQQ